MPLATSTTPKDPAKARAGRIGAQTRWHEPRVIDLRDLHPSVAAVVRAIVRAADNAAQRDPDPSADTAA